MTLAERLRSVGLQPPDDALSMSLWVDAAEGGVACVWAKDQLTWAWNDERFVVEVDRDVLEDCVVTALASEASTGDGAAAACALGSTQVKGTTQTGRIRQATQGLWRVLMAQPEVPPRLERLHADLRPSEPPWRTIGRRRIRAFSVLNQVPPIESGGWVVDARNVQSVTPEVWSALEDLSPLGDVWIEGRTPRPRCTLEELEGQRLRSLRWDAFRRLKPFLDERFHERAEEVLDDGAPLTDLDRWTQSWPRGRVPRDVVFLTPAPRFAPPPPPWLAFNATGLWAASRSAVRKAPSS